jgi:hypothetical protein
VATYQPRSRGATSALSVAQRVFTLSTAEPTNLFLQREDFAADVRAYLPDRRMLLRPLRDLLLRPHTPLWVRDAVWRELIGRARADRSSWLVVALGMAMPGLRREVRGLLVRFRGDRDDLESAVAEGFVREMYRVDLSEKALCARLVRAGRRAGVRQAYDDAAFEGAAWSAFGSHPPQAPYGHPDLVLVDAVRKRVLTREEAWLIGTTRLEGVPIDQVAALRGERPNTVVVRRHRAEAKLRHAIAAGDVECVCDLNPAASRRSHGEGCESVSVRVGRPVGHGGLTPAPFPGAGSPEPSGVIQGAG